MSAVKKITILSLFVIATTIFTVLGCTPTAAKPTFTQVPESATETATQSPTATATKTPIPTPTFSIGTSITSEKDGMILVYVPAGEFIMGSNSDDLLRECERRKIKCDNVENTDQKPKHTVYLDAFWIDQTEVTNAMYQKCVAEGGCIEPSSTSSYTRKNYYENPDFADYPVIQVRWEMANKYCLWANRRLPTEAEWEKSARGPDGFDFPWGNEAPNKELLNYNEYVHDTTKVGSYEAGKSIYGAYDMAGNVHEWVNDWYNPYYYKYSPSSNPTGPGPNIKRGHVYRGISWGYYNRDARSAVRGAYYIEYADVILGFRCAFSLENTSSPTTETIPGNSTESLTKKIEGETLFQDDFEDANTKGWRILSGNWIIALDDDDKANLALEGKDLDFAHIETGYSKSNWGDYIFEVDIKVTKESKDSRGEVVNLFFRGSNECDRYGLVVFSSEIELKKQTGSGCNSSTLGSKALNFPIDKWVKIRIEADNNEIKCFVNDEELLAAVDEHPHIKGIISLAVQEGGVVQFDNIKVIELQSIHP
jgi:formylglycine-generating enzyme required for sulfatase activity